MADEERRELQKQLEERLDPRRDLLGDAWIGRWFPRAAGLAVIAIAALTDHAWVAGLVAVIGSAVFVGFGVRARRRLMRGDS